VPGQPVFANTQNTFPFSNPFFNQPNFLQNMKPFHSTKLALCALILGTSTLASNAAETTGSTAAKTAAPAPATANAPATTSSAKPPRQFAGVSVGGQLTDFSGDNTKGTFLYGATVQVGGHLSKNKAFLKDLLLIADAGVYFGDWTDTLLDVRSAYTGPALPSWDFERSTLKRKSEQVNVPVFLTLAYDFQIGESLSLRVGPSAGVTYVSMKSKFSLRDEISSNDGTLMNVVTDAENKSGSKTLFSYGITLGASWAFTRNLGVDLQYRFQGSERLDLGPDRNYGASTTHQFNLGVSYRF
jgi:opacity protein-like surface antigen